MPSIEIVSDVDVGGRLRSAREASKLTQAKAATEIGVSRTTIVAIEKGGRRVRSDELQRLARLYGTSVNTLMRRESVHVDLQPRFRSLDTAGDAGLAVAVQLVSVLAKAEVELENLLGVVHERNYPPERSLLPGDVRVQAEHYAIELRKWLGIGEGPVRDIVSLLELDLGVRVYQRRLDAHVSGLFVYEDKVGACILLNANHPRERRAQTAAHEIGHLIAHRKTPEVLVVGDREISRGERFAGAFGRAFLTPSASVIRRFRQVTAGSSHLTRRHVIVLAHAFSVSREAMVRRLEDLGLVRRGTWDWFQSNGGITADQERQVLGDLKISEETAEFDKPTTLRLGLLASEAWRRDLLSEGQLARLMQLDRVEVRAMVDDLELPENARDDAPKLH